MAEDRVTQGRAPSLQAMLDRLGEAIKAHEETKPAFEPKPLEEVPEEDREAYAACLNFRRLTDSDDKYRQVCIHGEKVFYVPHDKALMPGHIYSPAGVAECLNSKMCEFHFDEATTVPEDDEPFTEPFEEVVPDAVRRPE